MTRLDTSSNYLRHRSHEILKETAGDLLPRFSVSTKVGFFREGHSLDPARLRRGAEHVVKTLGREPDVLFLHNPEHSAPDAEALAQACAALADTAQAGLCRLWGVSTWDPRPLVDLPAPPCPDVLMVRAGLLVAAGLLEAAESLASRWRPSRVWGMSPFGGSATGSVWERFDPRIFLRGSPPVTKVQAAFRTSFGLPPVDAVAVGTDDIRHLRELSDALAYDVDDEMLQEYRRLLDGRRQPA
ncbi:aldo/keto reductase [Streptomyces sp. NPDC046203]|uniref:aldo/keto reductase n=1 Tax=Streptomyces sp. NPDC046203 TaxID=3154602 RepID=UPI003401DB07